MGGGALGSNCVSELVGKEVRKRLVKLLSSPLAGEEAVVCDAKRALQMQERGIYSRNNKILSRISRFTAFTKKFYPLPEVEGKWGFSLAEVLITLGVIGVVAALTLPSVIYNYKKQSTVAKLQKAYSVINQAFKQSEVDNESSEFWDDPFVTGSQSYFEKYYKPYLKGAKQCFSYQECGYMSRTPFAFRDGSLCTASMDSTSLKRHRFAFYLPDGTFYWFLTKVGEVNLVPSETIYIDINGSKRPNVFGKDIFVFQRVAGKGILPDGYNYAKTTVDSNCVKSGSYCASKIMRDGWKITYPY